jgi:hypothetical protein
MAVTNTTNAVVAGAMEAFLQGRVDINNPALSTDFDTASAAASALATSVASILDDTTISTVPKTNLLQTITAGYMMGRFPIDPLAGGASAAAGVLRNATAIKAAYTSAATKLV